MAELRDRSAVKPCRDDDIPPRTHQREKRHDLRRVTRGTADRARAAFQRRDPLGQCRDGRVGQAGVDVAHFLEVEERGRVIGVAEDIGRRLVDRHLARPGRRIGPRAGMDLQRVEAIGLGHGGLPRE